MARGNIYDAVLSFGRFALMLHTEAAYELGNFDEDHFHSLAAVDFTDPGVIADVLAVVDLILEFEAEDKAQIAAAA